MYNLTTPQKNIWNLQKFYSESSISNVSGMLIFDEKLDMKALESAVNLFVKYQDGIRLQFSEAGSEVTQYVEPYGSIEVPVKTFDTIETVRKFFEAESKKPFSTMTDEKMYRFYLFETQNECGVFPVFSHLISDA